MKGVSSILTFTMVVAAVMVAVAVILASSKGTIETAITNVDIKDAESVLKRIDNNLREIVAEGNGSSRVLSFVASGRFAFLGEEDAVQFETEGGGFEYLSRSVKSGVVYIAGNDVSCGRIDGDQDGDADIVMENTALKVVFQLVNKTANLSSINTTFNVLSMTEKTGGKKITFSNTSVVIDNNASTAYGKGYSEILKEGTGLPVCTARFFVDSAIDYDIFYRLYAGADFLVAEVRVRE